MNKIKTLSAHNLSKIYDGNKMTVNTISGTLNGIIYDDQVYIQSFTGSQTWTPPTNVTSVDYLVVAGGGGASTKTSKDGLNLNCEKSRLTEISYIYRRDERRRGLQHARVR